MLGEQVKITPSFNPYSPSLARIVMAKRNQSVIDQEVSFSAQEELISTTDLRGVVTYANEAFCRVAGYSQQELVGKP